MALEQDVAALDAQVQQRNMLEGQLGDLASLIGELQTGLRSLREGHTPLQAEKRRLESLLSKQRLQAQQQESQASVQVSPQRFI